MPCENRNFVQNKTDKNRNFVQNKTDKNRDFVKISSENIEDTYILQTSKETTDKIYKSLILDDLGVNMGMIFENMVAQSLKANGYDLYFHEFNYKAENNDSEKQYEVDFVLVKGKRLVPIEVKSSSYKTHKSFDYFKAKYQLKINEQYSVYTKDLSVEDNVIYMPIYMTMCL